MDTDKNWGKLPFSWSNELKKDTSLATYSSYADGASHITGAFVQIDGKDIFQKGGAFKIKLNQRTLEHSTFEVHCSTDEFDSSSDFPFTNSRELINKRISIFFKQFNQTTFTFTGLITQVRRKKERQESYLVIEGASPDILLEDGWIFDSFEQKNLEEIAQQICQGYPSDLFNLLAKPKYKERIPYSVIYRETKYEYLKRLAQLYGEWLYWNGETLVFGGYGGKTVELLDCEDMESYELRIQTQPQNFSYLGYHSLTGEPAQSTTARLQKPSLSNHFQQYAVETSQAMYPSHPETYYNQSLLETGNKELYETVQRQSLHRQNVLFLEAKTRNPNLNIGDIIKLAEWTPESKMFKSGISPMERYLITEIEHHFESGEGYYNVLKGIPHEQWIPPYYNEQAYPRAEKQKAIVTDNNDPKGIGRIRVQFDWQKATHQQSPWIRMVFPYAGPGKGFYFLPEVGEEIMVDFESDNMEKPFVMGTLYNGKQKSGYYDSNNQLKAIHTNEGHLIEFDERKESMGITIKDKNGNSVHVSTKDNNLNLEALETLNFKAKNLNIEIEETITTKAGRDIKTTANNEITQNSMGKTQIYSNSNIQIEAQNTLDAYGKRKLITYTQGNAHMGALGQAHVHGTDALFTATNQLDYKAPTMGRLAESGEFKYTKEPAITEIIVMDENFEKEMDKIPSKGRFHVLVKTRNCEEGEILTLKIEENI